MHHPIFDVVASHHQRRLCTVLLRTHLTKSSFGAVPTAVMTVFPSYLGFLYHLWFILEGYLHSGDNPSLIKLLLIILSVERGGMMMLLNALIFFVLCMSTFMMIMCFLRFDWLRGVVDIVTA